MPQLSVLGCQVAGGGFATPRDHLDGVGVLLVVASSAVGDQRYPNFHGRHAEETVFSPVEVIERYGADPQVPSPDAVVLTYQRALLDELRARGLQPTYGYPGSFPSLWFPDAGDRKVAIAGGFGVGAPAATMVLEELIAIGAREFISIGAAGCLQPRYHFGETVVCTGAIRDEGVSHHYAATDKFAWPSEPLTARLSQSLSVGGTAPEAGMTWTIDAPYRETVAEARSYQAEGVVCVEMEAAALFTVAKYRDVDIAAAFVVSDHLLTEDRWTHAFGTEVLRNSLVRLLDAALRTLGSEDPPA